MRFGSVCSGIEAASVAWNPLGWKAAWLSEIEPFPSAVLAHHYPDVSNLGDMTLLPERIRSGEVEAPDLFCGGTPCQAFSVAGLRKSLDDARGNLSLTFCEIANAIDDVRSVRGDAPAIIFWENVPGVLSTKDNAFGCFLAGLAGEDGELKPSGGKWTNAGCVYGPQRAVAWRVLDAQYFGVAQRRRRVFVVASARDNFDPAAVLFEFNGVRRDTAPSREAGKAVARSTGTSATFSCAGIGSYTDEDAAATLLKSGQDLGNGCEAIITMAHGQGGAEIGFDNGPTLTCNHEAPIAAIPESGVKYAHYSHDYAHDRITDPTGVNPALTKEAHASGNLNVAVPMATTQFGDMAGTLTARHDSSPCADRGMNVVAHPIALQDVTPRQKAQNGKGWNDDGTSYTVDTHATQGVAQPIAFHPTQDPISSADVCHSIGANENATAAVAFQQTADCLTAAYGTKWNGNASATNGSLFAAQAIGWDEELNASTEQSGTLLRGGQGGRHDGVMTPAMQVRRLTPTECERLQGFPDGWTQIPWRKKTASECPDGPRYKALGNSWAVPVVRWIGKRIQEAL